MADEEATLLARLAPWIDETVASKALAHILNQSTASRQALDMLIRDGGVNIEPVAEVKPRSPVPVGYGLTWSATAKATRSLRC